MRVLFVVLEDFPGGDTRVRRQAAALLSRGHNVDVLCATAYSEQVEWEGCNITRTWTRRKKAGSLSRRFAEYLLFTFECMFRVTFIGIRSKVDLVQVANMPDILTVAAMPLRFLHGCPIVLDLHDLMPELMASKDGNARALTKLLRWQETVGVRIANAVMTVNENCARLLRQRHPEIQISTVPNSPDERTFLRRTPRLRTAGGCIRIGYHGTVAKRFGVATLLASFPRLRQEGVEATLDVWGGGDDLDTVKCLARTLGIERYVRFHGQTPVDRLAEMLQSLDVSVVPYEADAYMAIAYSTKAFELAAIGIPIVISDLPGIREQFTEKAVAYFLRVTQIVCRVPCSKLLAIPRVHKIWRFKRRLNWTTFPGRIWRIHMLKALRIRPQQAARNENTNICVPPKSAEIE